MDHPESSIIDFEPSRPTPGIKVRDPAGHIFGLPELPLPSKSHIKHRYDAIVEQFTNLMMQDGKKARAQTVGQSVPLLFMQHLSLLETSWLTSFANDIF